jgi:hypothetical protein
MMYKNEVLKIQRRTMETLLSRGREGQSEVVKASLAAFGGDRGALAKIHKVIEILAWEPLTGVRDVYSQGVWPDEYFNMPKDRLDMLKDFRVGSFFYDPESPSPRIQWRKCNIRTPAGELNFSASGDLLNHYWLARIRSSLEKGD